MLKGHLTGFQRQKKKRSVDSAIASVEREREGERERDRDRDRGPIFAINFPGAVGMVSGRTGKMRKIVCYAMLRGAEGFELSG
jgi:hypothetical protein